MSTHDPLTAPMPGADTREVAGVRLDIVKTGAGRVKRAIYPAGFRWSTHMKPVTGTDICQHTHINFLTKNHIHIHFPNNYIQKYKTPTTLTIKPNHNT